jgi:hypothetical protein
MRGDGKLLIAELFGVAATMLEHRDRFRGGGR